MKPIHVAIFAIWAPFAVLAAGQSDETDATASFNRWSAFFEEDSCWVATQPMLEDGTILESVFVYVAFNDNLALPQVAIYAEQGFEDSSVILTSQDDIFELDVNGNAAFPEIEDDVRILKSILAGLDFTLIYNTSGPTETTGFISANGFPDAYNFISRECDFRFVPYMSEDLGVEPA
jgi:hypothetical protein